eukprot:753838-Hanusia_phi.AAC.7
MLHHHPQPSRLRRPVDQQLLDLDPVPVVDALRVLQELRGCPGLGEVPVGSSKRYVEGAGKRPVAVARREALGAALTRQALVPEKAVAGAAAAEAPSPLIAHAVGHGNGAAERSCLAVGHAAVAAQPADLSDLTNAVAADTAPLDARRSRQDEGAGGEKLAGEEGGEGVGLVDNPNASDSSRRAAEEGEGTTVTTWKKLELMRREAARLAVMFCASAARTGRRHNCCHHRRKPHTHPPAPCHSSARLSPAGRMSSTLLTGPPTCSSRCRCRRHRPAQDSIDRLRSRLLHSKPPPHPPFPHSSSPAGRRDQCCMCSGRHCTWLLPNPPGTRTGTRSYTFRVRYSPLPRTVARMPEPRSSRRCGASQGLSRARRQQLSPRSPSSRRRFASWSPARIRPSTRSTRRQTRRSASTQPCCTSAGLEVSALRPRTGPPQPPLCSPSSST